MTALDGVEEEAQDAGLVLLGAQQDGGEGGREGQRVEGRDRDGEGDGERELLVENAGGSGEEADRDEDGDEHERGRDDGAGDLAPWRSKVASMALSQCSSSMWRWTFSMTTMASSTTSPVARVMPKRVSELMEKPKILMKAKVPMSETGMVTAGMMVARQSCRKRKMTMMTMMMASADGLHRPPGWSRR